MEKLQTKNRVERRRNIPLVRFPEFEGKWEEKKLGDICYLTSSKRVYLSDYVKEGIPFYRGKEITELKNGKQPTNILYISAERYKEYKSKYGIPKINDILITAVGTLGNVLKIRNDNKFYFKDGNLIWLKNIEENPDFLEVLIQLNTNALIRTSIGSTQKALTMVELRKLKFYFPTLPEQTCIANFFTVLDNKINQLKEKKALLEEYKKGVMQKIFSQELRFRDENGKDFPEWEEKKLGEIGETYNGLTGKTKENFGKGKPYIQYKQIFENSIIDISKFGLVDVNENEKQNKALYGDLFFTISSETPNEIGFSSVILENIQNLYLNSFCFGFRPNSLKELNPKFAQFLFRSEIARKKIVKLSQGSTRYNMSKVQFMKIKIKLPCSEEQTKIANFLSAIDNKITKVDNQIEQTEQWKKGLLQQMFV